MNDPIIRLADSLIAASVDGSLWNEALRSVSAYLGCVAVAIEVVCDGQRPRHDIIINDIQDAMRSPAGAYHLPRNPRIALAKNIHGPSDVMYDAQLGSDAELQRHPFYADFLRPVGVSHFAGSLLVRRPGFMIAASLHRSPDQGHVQTHDIERFRAINPLLARSVYVAETIEQHALKSEAALYDRPSKGRGIFVLSTDAILLHHNRVGEEMLRSGDGITIGHRHVRATAHHIDRRFQDLVRRVGEREFPAGRGLSVARSSGAADYAVLLMPFDGNMVRFAQERPAVLMIVADPDMRMSPDATILRDLFELTPREAELAALLANGHSVEEAAVALGVGSATARTHLSAVFRKTATRRQGELVGLVASLTP